MDYAQFTPTQRRLMKAMEDGMPHRPSELLPLIDELASRDTLKNHICVIRKKLRELNLGEDIVAQSFGRGIGYRRIRLLTVSTGIE